MASLNLTVNGRQYRTSVDPKMPLLWMLRDALSLTGTNFGCGTRFWGACTLLCFFLPYVAAGGATRIPTWRQHLDAAHELQRRGNLDASERELTLALAATGHASSDDRPLAQVLNALGDFYDDVGRFNDAERCWTESLKLWSRILGPQHVALSRVVNRLASLYIETHQLGKAKLLDLDGWEQRLEHTEPASVDLRQSLESVAQFHSLRGDSSEAETMHLRALKLTLNPDGTETVESVGVLNNLGLMYLEAGRYEAAIEYLSRAVRTSDGLGGPDGLTAASARHTLAEAYLAVGRYAEAEALLRSALPIAERSFGPNSLRTAAILKSYGRFLRLEHRNREARTVEARVRAIERDAERAGSLRDVIDIRELSLR